MLGEADKSALGDFERSDPWTLDEPGYTLLHQANTYDCKNTGLHTRLRITKQRQGINIPGDANVIPDWDKLERQEGNLEVQSFQLQHIKVKMATQAKLPSSVLLYKNPKVGPGTRSSRMSCTNCWYFCFSLFICKYWPSSTAPRRANKWQIYTIYWQNLLTHTGCGLWFGEWAHHQS